MSPPTDPPLVLITGGSRGIGRSIAKSVLEAGCSVHLLAREESRLRHTARELGSLGRITFSSLDVADTDELLSFCKEWNQPISGLVNNAGYWIEDSIDTLDVSLFAGLLSVNLLGPYILTKGLLPQICDGGRIVNIASQLGTSGRARMGAYAASKHGLIGLTRCWACEVADRAVTVNAVCPGWVNTESNRIELTALANSKGTTLEQEMGAISAGLLLHRFIEPQEVAQLVTFLLGAGASGITGQVYEIK